MTVLAASNFLALLAIVAFGAVLVTGGLLLLDRAGGPGPLSAVRSAIGPGASLWLAALVAVTSTAGSLYFSEVAHFVPCTLCWYQRIAMYPLALVLAVAAWRGDLGVRRYVLPLAAIGALVSVWHIGVERLPGLPSGACSASAPCDLIWVQALGFVTIPVMALAGFLAIVTLLTVYAATPNPSREGTAS